MKQFGLIGYPLGHSYSKDYFEKKFIEMGLDDHRYEFFEMKQIQDFSDLWKRNQHLIGVNVTVPHKENVIQYLDELDESAIKVGAVNVVMRLGEKLKGYNTDYLAFRESLQNWFNAAIKGNAMILGSGGASKAVQASLEDLNIPFVRVSRSEAKGSYTYQQLMNEPALLDDINLIVNTTPLGMHPLDNICPDIPYHQLTKDCHLYDLIYNPEVTEFMKRGQVTGAKVKNGYEMLVLQAEKSWEIWNS